MYENVTAQCKDLSACNTCYIVRTKHNYIASKLSERINFEFTQRYLHKAFPDDNFKQQNKNSKSNKHILLNSEIQNKQKE